MSKINSIRVPVRHISFGEGHGIQFAENAGGKPLLFIRWLDFSGVAGGWYDPTDEKLTIEDIRLLNNLYARDIETPAHSLTKGGE